MLCYVKHMSVSNELGDCCNCLAKVTTIATRFVLVNIANSQREIRILSSDEN